MTNRRNLGRDGIVASLKDRKGYPKDQDVLFIRLDPESLNDLDVFSLGAFGCIFDFETHPRRSRIFSKVSFLTEKFENNLTQPRKY